MLTTSDHNRETAGLTYVYPVVSRRAGGVSLGINLNINNACNWACVYCQVPDLRRGGPPPVDLQLLATEFRSFLDQIVHGDFMTRKVPEGSRRLSDVAFSGNGEPTLSPEFAAAVEVVTSVIDDFGVKTEDGMPLPVRLITNGSMLNREATCRGIALINMHGGEVWFKVDRVTPNGIAEVNGVRLNVEQMRANLLRCATLAPTWIQTCLFGLDRQLPAQEELRAYISFVTSIRSQIQGIHLYGIARQAMQSGAERLYRLPEFVLKDLAVELKTKGLRVTINP